MDKTIQTTQIQTPEELAEIVYKVSDSGSLAAAVRNYARWLNSLIKPNNKSIKEQLQQILTELTEKYKIESIECEPTKEYIMRTIENMSDEQAKIWFDKTVNIIQQTYAKLPRVAEAIREYVIAIDDKSGFGWDELDQIKGELYDDLAKALCQMRGYDSNRLQFGRPRHIQCVYAETPFEKVEKMKNEEIVETIQNTMDWLNNIVNNAERMTYNEVVNTMFELAEKVNIKYVECVPVDYYVKRYVNEDLDWAKKRLQKTTKRALDQLKLRMKIAYHGTIDNVRNEYQYWIVDLRNWVGDMLCAVGYLGANEWSTTDDKIVKCK